MHQLKELLDHLYFLVLYAIPATIDKSDREFSDAIFNAYIGTVIERDVDAAIAEKIHNQIQFLKQEMLNNVSFFRMTQSWAGKYRQGELGEAVHWAAGESQDLDKGLVQEDLYRGQIPS